MIAPALTCILLVYVVALGFSLNGVGLFRLRPAEAVVAGCALSLVGAWVVAWAIFTLGGPVWAYSLLPAFAALSLLNVRSLARLLRDAEARDLLAGQVLVTGWCIGLLAFIRTQSGGAWMADNFEHWERAHFFLRQWPVERLFIDTYQLPARPPLANVLMAMFLSVTRIDYLHYQLFSTALASLAFLPVGLFASRFGGRPAIRMAAVVVMVSPLFVQNATFPWTKLPAAFFILAGLYFYLRVRDGGPDSVRMSILSGVSLGGALITHYSAGPYVVTLAVLWIALRSRPEGSAGFAKRTLAAAAAGFCILAPWFAWSVIHYGWSGTFLSNSSVTSLDRWQGSQLLKIVLNLRDTLLPSQVRGFTGRLFVQTSPWAALRDQGFLLYQVNLVFAFGSIGWLVLAREGWRAWREAVPADRLFWAAALAGFVVLSIAVYGDREHYGMAHICLQSVVLLGLAFLASRWGRIGKGWRRALAVGWTIDILLGIALQFAVEDYAIDAWVHPGVPVSEVVRTYSPVAQVNFEQETTSHLVHFGDIMSAAPALVLAVLGALFFIALLRAHRTPAAAPRS